MSFVKLDACPLCNDKNIKRVYTTQDRHYGIQGDFTIDKCGNCGLVFLNPMPTNEDLTSLYPETYYSYQDFAEQTSFFKKIFRKYIIRFGTYDPVFAKPGRMLDIGCGSGKFLYQMKEKGWEVAGVEVNESAAKLGNETAGLNIHAGDLLTASYAPESFDYIRSNHSFEHITNPDEVLERVHSLLKKDGKLLIGVPNIDSFNARLFKKYWWYLGAPVHPFNYSVSTLTRILNKHGFAVEKVRHNGDYGGVIGSMQIYLNRNNGKKSEDGPLLKLLPVRIIGHQLARILNFFKTGDTIELTAVKK